MLPVLATELMHDSKLPSILTQLLNLMRVEDVDPEYLLRASFHQFQREQDAPALISQAEEIEKEVEMVQFSSSEEAQLALEYYQMDQQLLLTRRKIKDIVLKPDYVWKFLQQAGRILEVTIDGEQFGWGALVACTKKQGMVSGDVGSFASNSSGPTYALRVLLMCVDRHFDDKDMDDKERGEDVRNSGLLWRGSSRECRPARLGVDDDKIIHMREFGVDLDQIERISAVKIFMPQDLTSSSGRKKVELSIKELMKRFPDDSIPLLDPVKDMGVNDSALQTLLSRAKTLGDRIAEHKLFTDFSKDQRVELVAACEKKRELQEQAKVLREEARESQTIVMKDDLRKMKKVLKRLGHVDANGVIQTKGRTACEVGFLNLCFDVAVSYLIMTFLYGFRSTRRTS